ncbi:transmembrane protein (plasmid) [Legionella adelaidensis]|uniref:Alpha/beta superfamily transporter hydrolase n=1 Tax=Legionella adelaidensis TaxID=45056 RepID=A0A0W0R605_9GAMM|nr:hypothetical protein [Legionella adelaidensis]KTC66471.1 alpha/beta superfamily transporter hydrolase [Legionella adelaidensis]VEH86241.1 transmembrane protein [Legionella adelaidensis]
MISKELLNEAGEHIFSFEGAGGHILDARLLVPEKRHPELIAVLGHPHSLQGGTMQNKVVTTMARAFREHGIASVRFNFRGVEKSEGEYNHGIGESEDMLFLAREFKDLVLTPRFIFAGFSFGSYVAYRAAAQCPHQLLITIAPPIHHYDYTEFKITKPWVVVQGDEDEVVPPEVVYEFVEKRSSSISLLNFSGTGHFFHGKLIELKDRLKECITFKVSL